MFQVIAVGGEPATGKTTAMLAILSTLGELQPFEFGRVKGYVAHGPKVILLGIYDGKTFAGTDRLSMTVITDARKLLEWLKGNGQKKFRGYTVLFEGDRLFNQAFLRDCIAAAEQTRFFVLEVSAEEKERRHKQRGDTQSASWLKGRATKTKGIIDAFPGQIDVFQNADELQQGYFLDAVCDTLVRFANGSDLKLS